MAVDHPWPVVTIGDLSDDITVGHVGPMAHEYVPDGIPFLRSLNVQPFRISREDLKYVSSAFHQRLQKSRLRPGDVVVVRTGKPGTAAVVPVDLPDANCSDLVIIRPGAGLDARFLTYYLNSAGGQGHVNSRLVGAVQQHFNVAEARRMRIPRPAMGEQRAIAGILGALDDKIELNRRTNETLEAIARAIFKSWFVDFDPVRAKMEGRQPIGMDAETAALFPQEFQSSPFGEIPKHWTTGPLGERIEILSGGTPSTSVAEFWNGPVPWVSIADTVPGPYIITTEKSITQAGLAGSPARLLPPETLVLTARGTVGNCALIAEPMAMNQSCYGLRGTDGVGQLFLLHQVREQVARLRSSAHGSVFDTITRATFSSLDVVWPSQPVMRAFESRVRPLFELILSGSKESKTLGTIRDALLPKLLSGELRVGG